MSAQEIIAELPKLNPDEFRLVKAKVDDLAKTRRRTIGDALLEFAGTAEGLPRDMARNHDHYLHGTPRPSREVRRHLLFSRLLNSDDEF